MTDLYLIAHKVRGEPAFDVARRFCESKDGPCQPECGCWNGSECSMIGEWIIPTSGHRAFPYWMVHLGELIAEANAHKVPPLPEGLRDHYEVTASTPSAGKSKKTETIDLADLGLI